ncbi:MAG: hypothetical protein RLZZ444_2614, partial [Pseudomonadota bacterium]
GQTVIVNKSDPAVPGAADVVTTKDNVPAAVPLILASEKAAPGTVGRRVPLDMFLNNQTSYEKLLDAVAPSKSKTDADKTSPVKADASKADPAKPDSARKTTADKQNNPDDVATDPAADQAADADKVLTDDRSKPINPSDTSLMQALGVTPAVDNLPADDERAKDEPESARLPDTTSNAADTTRNPKDTIKNITDTTENPVDKASDAADAANVAVVKTQEDQSLPVAADDTPRSDVPATTENTQETVEPVRDRANKTVATNKAVTPAVLDVAQLNQTKEAEKAVRQLRDATTAILKLNKSTRLNDLLGPERGKDVQQALDRISVNVKQQAAIRPLIAEKTGPQNASACWQGSNITPDVLPTLIFWLDLLSISENVSINDLFIDNYGLLLEAGLSPDRVRDCLLRQKDPEIAKLAESSIYLEEVGRNPDFIRFLLRSSPTYNMALAGASTNGARYIQLDNGDKLTEGAAPSLNSRIASIGELGVLVKVPNGYVAEVYPKSMPWMIR